ncbi:MAG: DUF4197 domain-containing protein [Lentisphaeraceae bacterium]|nr:DUF4197 domain-containing protein [Lentisphaeraceae bacterium]
MTFLKSFLAVLVSVSFISCQSVSDNTYGALKSLLTGELTDSSIASGLKEALNKGTEKAVANLSKNGGYSKNLLYKIAVPEDLQKFSNTLKKIGLGSQVDYFETKMNEAAEEACIKAGPIFVNAISEMTLEDVREILMGSQTAATDYFRQKTSQHLKAEYFPIVKTKMEEIGLVGDYNDLMSKYNSIPFTPKVNFGLEDYVTEKALSGLFSKLAETEKDIRENPAARTSDLLKRVFAEQDKK